MSAWDTYIDNLIGRSSGSCDKVCIIGLDGSSWTSSGAQNALVLQGNEGATIGNCFKSKDFSTFASNGVHVGGTKYRFLRELDGVVLAKMKDQGAITMQASKTAIVIAHCPEGQQQGNLNTAVSAISDYLSSTGY